MANGLRHESKPPSFARFWTMPDFCRRTIGMQSNWRCSLWRVTLMPDKRHWGLVSIFSTYL